MKCTRAAVAVFRGALRMPLLLVACAGCQSVPDGAKEWFAKANLCPPERIETRERTDLTPASFHKSGGPSGPPAEIAADPARLKMWRDQQAQLKSFREQGHHIVEVRGCDKHVVYDCRHPQTARGIRWWCDDVKVPDDFPTW